MYIEIKKCDSADLAESLLAKLRQSNNDCIKKRLEMLQKKKYPNQSIAATSALLANLQKAGLEQRHLGYQIDDYGKPFFTEAKDWHFSNSHSGMYGMSVLNDSPVGCDIENIKPGRERVAKRFFSEAENQMLDQLKGEEQTHLFYMLWTMKESYAKLLGTGLRIPLSEIQIAGLQSLGIPGSPMDKKQTGIATEGLQLVRMKQPGQSVMCQSNQIDSFHVREAETYVQVSSPYDEHIYYGCWYDTLYPDYMIAVCGGKK